MNIFKRISSCVKSSTGGASFDMLVKRRIGKNTHVLKSLEKYDKGEKEIRTDHIRKGLYNLR